MITYTWTIQQLWAAPSLEGLQNVVTDATWRCLSTDGTHTVLNSGTCSFSPVPEEFTPFASLTEQQVLNWCWAVGVNKLETEAALSARIDELVNPTIVSLPLPWAV